MVAGLLLLQFRTSLLPLAKRGLRGPIRATLRLEQECTWATRVVATGTFARECQGLAQPYPLKQPPDNLPQPPIATILMIPSMPMLLNREPLHLNRAVMHP